MLPQGVLTMKIAGIARDRRHRRNLVFRSRRFRAITAITAIRWGELLEAWRRRLPRGPSTPRRSFLEGTKSLWRSGRDDTRKMHFSLPNLQLMSSLSEPVASQY